MRTLLAALTLLATLAGPALAQKPEVAEIYRALVELNAAALRWERIHWCDRSSGSDSWCGASGISPLFPVLPPAPGMPAPGTFRGATSW